MKKFFKDAKGHLMTGISYMLPLIVGASLVLAIPKLIGVAMGIYSLNPYAESTGFLHILYLIEQVGWAGIGLINTVLAGFIAYSIADKAAIGAGFIGGTLASNSNAGFLGAVIAGFIAGYAAKWVKEYVQLPKAISQMLPMIVCPLISTGVVAIIMGVILTTPLSALNDALVSWVSNMCSQGNNQFILSLILGAMIASDLGGPINKAALMAGIALFMEGVYQPLVYINCAICIPPLAYAIATLLRKKKFSDSFREAGIGNWVMAFIGITEGAIPFTLVKPIYLIPINMIGGAIGAGVCHLLGAVAKIPPLGGIYGFIALTNGWAYLVGIIAGALFIALTSTIFVDFHEDETSENVDIDDIDITLE